ncbi:GHKL domain-containing protein [Enterococcus gilvus]|uniref:sensor histidine kinase n=1 Tax=Enterococcus gilvus TaxID=160453 RepID=UPI0029082E87|nr:GHKL domain-containing protein [Enterococcus gilvus]MDU5512110.1 GHKL domain-containing protein [Enterococcus gilvus]
MQAMIITFFTFSHVLNFGVSYFILDEIKNKKRINYLLVPLIVLFGVVIGYTFTYLDTVVMVLFFLILSLKNSEERNVVFSLLIVSSACLIEILVSRITEPLLLIVLEKQNGLFFLLFFVLYYALLILSSSFYKKHIVTFIRKKRKINLSAYLLTTALVVYFSYGTISLYASTVFLKLFVAVFYLIFAFLGGVIIQSISSNQELKIEAEKRQVEYVIHQRYIEDLKNQYQGIREFRHDYVNLLTAIEYYIEKEEFDGLKTFFNSSVIKTKRFTGNDILHADELNKIDSLDIKSILTMKLLAAQDKKIDVQIEADDGIRLNQKVDSVVLIRILGILLDNAVEEVERIEGGKIVIGIFSVKGDTIFVIENTARQQLEPMHVLKQKGFSTKGEGRGLGLSNIDELTAMEPNILLETIISEQRFTQKVVVIGEEEERC